MIEDGTKFLGVDASVPTPEVRSSQVNAVSSMVTIEEIAEKVASINNTGLVYERNGIATQTSGTLVVGETYTIGTYGTGDDFSNVADVQSGNIDEDGCVFIATGTTPLVWVNGTDVTNSANAILVEGAVSDIIGFNKIRTIIRAEQIHALGITPAILVNGAANGYYNDYYKAIVKYHYSGLDFVAGGLNVKYLSIGESGSAGFMLNIKSNMITSYNSNSFAVSFIPSVTNPLTEDGHIDARFTNSPDLGLFEESGDGFTTGSGYLEVVVYFKSVQF